MKYVIRALIVCVLLSFTAVCWGSALDLAVSHGGANNVWLWLLISLGSAPMHLLYRGIWNYIICQYTIREVLESWT